MERFNYFTIRVRHQTGTVGAREISGVIEHLATGEKREFGDGLELVRIIAGARQVRGDPGLVDDASTEL